MEKELLKSYLGGIEVNLLLFFIYQEMIKNVNCLNSLKDSKLNLPNGETIFVGQMVENLKNKKGQLITHDILETSIIRTTIREMFEVVKDYCKETNQMTQLKSNNWYWYLKVLRNGCAHNFKFVFNPDDKSQMPIRWNNKVIDESLEDQYLVKEYAYLDDCFLLLETVKRFADNIN